MKTAVAPRTRRPLEQQIADLRRKIEKVKARAAAKQVRHSPTLRHVKSALKSIQKAMAASDDHVLRAALDEARSTLSACMAMKGVLMPTVRVEREQPDVTRNGHLAPDELLKYIVRNPGQRSEQITAALETDAIKLRGVMRQLMHAGKVKASGVARGTTYSAA